MAQGYLQQSYGAAFGVLLGVGHSASTFPALLVCWGVTSGLGGSGIYSGWVIYLRGFRGLFRLGVYGVGFRFQVLAGFVI